MTVLIVRIARGSWERCEVGSWLAGVTAHAVGAGLDIRIGTIDQEPTTTARNKAVRVAREIGAGVLVMVDDDMLPAEGFFPRALDFLAKHPGPVVVGSPYCGARSAGCPVQVMLPAGDGLARVHRDYAAGRTGFEPVGAVGTGLIACNLLAFAAVEPPFFDYAYTSPAREEVAETEDFHFCRKLTAAGGRVWVDWDSWSGHCKAEVIGKPESGGSW